MSLDRTTKKRTPQSPQFSLGRGRVSFAPHSCACLREPHPYAADFHREIVLARSIDFTACLCRTHSASENYHFKPPLLLLLLHIKQCSNTPAARLARPVIVSLDEATLENLRYDSPGHR